MGTMLVLEDFDQTRYQAGLAITMIMMVFVDIIIIPLNIRSRRNFKGHLRGENTAASRGGLTLLKHTADQCFFLTSFPDIFQRTKGSLLTYP